MNSQASGGNIGVVLAGDAMVTRRLSVFQEPAYMGLVELFRGSNVAFCNLEMPIPDYEDPFNFDSGTHMTSLQSAAQELRWMGINVVSTANNHIYDFGERGILSTQRKLDEAGIMHAGTGRNLSEARAACYLDTANGRVAVLAAVSYFPEWGKAGEQRPDFPGRPGLSFLRHEITHVVDARSFQDLRRISESLGFEKMKAQRAGFGPWAGHYERDPNELYFLTSFKLDRGFDFRGEKFMLGDHFQTMTQVHPPDAADILRWIRDARRQADLVVFSLHGHEGAYPQAGAMGPVWQQGLLDVPADFVTKFARTCIDEGADIVVAHGPHAIRGIEIYHGKPLFYSLGELIFQIETIQRLPAIDYSHFGLGHEATPADYFDARSGKDTRSFAADPVYWQSVAAKCIMANGKLQEIELYPIELGQGQPRTQRGRPFLAQEPTAGAIIHRLQELSQTYGTEIKRDGGRWVIRP